MSVARRRHVEEHENHERWLISYADFITLLFAFFVVMYSISSVNEGKYRVLSDSLLNAFTGDTRSASPVQVGEVMRAPIVEGQAPPSSLVQLDNPNTRPIEMEQVVQGEGDEFVEGGEPQNTAPVVETEPQEPGQPLAGTDEMLAELNDALAPQIEEDLIEIKRTENWIEIEMKSNFLFTSGDARMNRKALDVIRRLSQIMRSFPNPVQVEGHTDDIPISTVAFPSNWELSAARAASVVHLFTRYGVRPDRLTAIGYGEYRPKVANDSAENRAANRRVNIIIPATRHARSQLETARMLDRAKTGLRTVPPAPRPRRP